MASTPCSPSQWNLGLYRSLLYPNYSLHLNCSYLIGLFTSAVSTGLGFFGPRVFELGNIAVCSKLETVYMGCFTAVHSLGLSKVY